MAEDRVARVLGAWRARLDAGEFVAPDELFKEHPDIAGELRRRLAMDEVLAAASSEKEFGSRKRLASPSRSSW